MRNKSEEKPKLPALPPSYSWRVIKGQHQAWWKGGAKFWTRKDRGVTIEDVVAKCWAKWTEDTGLTQERYFYMLRCESLVSQI